MTTLSARTWLGLRILGAALALGIAGDQLLRPTPWGLNTFLCVVGLVGAALWIARRSGIALTADTLWLGAGALLVASSFLARDSRALLTCDVIGLALIGALSYMTLQPVGLRDREVPDYARACVTAAVSMWTGVLPLVVRDVAWSELPSRGALRQARGVALGVLVAFPLLVVFGALFAAADPVFASVITGIADLDFASVASHTFAIGFLGVLAAGYLRGALVRPDPAPAGASAPAPGISLGVVPVVTALGLLDLLFLLFVVVQLRYFYGGSDVIRETVGLTYAEYARRGFLELVIASALALPVLLALDWAVRDEPTERQRVFRHLAAVLLILLGVVVISAFRRVWLYVAEFGLSEIRIYATAFMAWLAGVSLWFAWTVLRGRRRRFAFGALVQGFAVLAGLHLANPDATIVRVNAARPAVHRPFDGAYAASLSADAVPALLAALPRLGAAERCDVAKRLLARWSGDAARAHESWRNWNLARERARRAVGERETDLRTQGCRT